MGRALGLALLAAATLCRCTTAPVSLGNDDLTQCRPEECGPEPSTVPVCANGVLGQFICDRDPEQTCTWAARCPVTGCAAADCGAPPREPPMCSDDSVPGLGWVCEPNGVSACAWAPFCSEDMRECPLDDCEDEPEDATECSTLGMDGSGCLRESGGSCGWAPVACRP